MSGKGSKPRPFSDRKKFEQNWDAIFGSKAVTNQIDTSTPEEEDENVNGKAKQVQSGDT